MTRKISEPIRHLFLDRISIFTCRRWQMTSMALSANQVSPPFRSGHSVCSALLPPKSQAVLPPHPHRASQRSIPSPSLPWHGIQDSLRSLFQLSAPPSEPYLPWGLAPVGFHRSRLSPRWAQLLPPPSPDFSRSTFFLLPPPWGESSFSGFVATLRERALQIPFFSPTYLWLNLVIPRGHRQDCPETWDDHEYAE